MKYKSSLEEEPQEASLEPTKSVLRVTTKKVRALCASVTSVSLNHLITRGIGSLKEPFVLAAADESAIEPAERSC